MLKVRIEGEPREIPLFIESLKDVVSVESVSKFYPNRGDTKRGRVYVDIIAPGQERKR